MNKKIVFIAGDVRSGSTLVDFYLGQETNSFSCGELHWISYYFNNSEITLCKCGENINNCSTWSELKKSLIQKYNYKGQLTRVKRNNLNKLIFGVSDYTKKEDLILKWKNIIINELFNLTDKNLMIDSSLSYEEAHSYQKNKNTDSYIILLYKNMYQSVYSKYKRGHSLVSSCLSYNLNTIKAISLIKSSVNNLKFLEYEQFCNKPQETRSNLYSWFDIKYTSKTEKQINEDTHIIRGNACKANFKKNMKIIPDDNYKKKLSKQQLLIVKLLCASLDKKIRKKVTDYNICI